jgi:cytochrome bd-type quinol oxidase subunit 2
MTQRTGGQGRGGGRRSSRAAAWLAWSLVTLSVVLLVGGISFALMARSSVSERPYYGLVTLSVLALAFSVVGAIIASRQPRNAIGWLFCSVSVTIGLTTPSRGTTPSSGSRATLARDTSARRQRGSLRGRGPS